MAALLTSERANTDRIVSYIGECRAMGIEVLPPDVNESDIYFTVCRSSPPATAASGAEFTSAERAGGSGGARRSAPPLHDAIRFGLAAIKNVGEGAVEAVLQMRRRGEPFRSLFDFCERVDLRAVNRRVVESFIKSGCYDSLDRRRAALMNALDRAMDVGQKRQRDRDDGQSSLLGLLGGGAAVPDAAAERVRDLADWPEGERLAYEKESLGFFITGHPLERFQAELAQMATATTGKLPELAEREVTVGGIVVGLRLIKTKKGDRMASFTLEDLEGGVEVLVFPETYRKVATLLADDVVVLVKGRAESVDEGRSRLLATDVVPLDQARLAEARFVTIRVPVTTWDRAQGERLRDILGSHRGECPVTLEMVRPGGESVAVAPSAYFRVRADQTLRAEVEGLLGPGSVVLARTSET